MTLDQRLVNKGKSEPRDGLAQQGKVHVGLAQQYATDLADSGWSATDTTSLAANVVNLEQVAGSQSAGYDHAGHTSTTESDAIDGAKAFIRRLRAALPRTLRDNPAHGLTIDSFHVGEVLGRSTPKITKYLAAIRPGLETLDVALQSHFKGQKATVDLDAVKAALDSADTAQELARKNAPSNTLALYEVMGKVLEQIEDLNRAGKIAFDGDAATRGKFNKDILLRASKARSKKKADAATPPAAPRALGHGPGSEQNRPVADPRCFRRDRRQGMGRECLENTNDRPDPRA